MSYIANVDVAAFLQITLSTAQQAAIDAIITGVEKAAESACNRTWNVTAQQVETFDGATDIFFPKHGPIASIASVTLDGNAVDADQIYNYGSYVKIYCLSLNRTRNFTYGAYPRLWHQPQRGVRNVVITYTGKDEGHLMRKK